MKIKPTAQISVAIIFLLAHITFVVRDSFACSCTYDADLTADLTNEEHLLANFEDEFTKVVFVGTVLEILDKNETNEVVNTADPLTVLFEVETVYKGEANTTMTLKTERNSASCGYLFNKGHRYLVFATIGLNSGLCSGNIDNPSDELLLVLGDGQPPARLEAIEVKKDEDNLINDSGEVPRPKRWKDAVIFLLVCIVATFLYWQTKSRANKV